jgi:hypothetical protein
LLYPFEASYRPCGTLCFGVSDPAVALCCTAGYVHHAPCEVTENVRPLNSRLMFKKCRFLEVLKKFTVPSNSEIARDYFSKSSKSAILLYLNLMPFPVLTTF